MPWQNNGGGGPWGGGGGPSPWGRPPSGGGPSQPPNIEDLLRRSQDRMRRLLPGGLGPWRGVALAAAVLVGLWLLSGFYRVLPDQQGVVQRFGEWVRTTGPGLNYHLPAPIETVKTPSITRINSIEIGNRSGDARSRDQGESLMLTGDENIVDIDFTVNWTIKDAGQFLFGVRDPETLVKVAAESAMREVIGRTKIQDALTEGRGKVEADTQTLLQSLLDSYGAGVSITQVQLRTVDPPEPVVDAFNEVQRAHTDAERAVNEAQAYRNKIVPTAEGDAVKITQEAEAYRKEVVLRAEGEASRFLSVLKAYQASPDITARRLYIETMEQILKSSNKVLIDKAVSQTGAIPYLPLPAIPTKPHGEAKPEVQP